MWLISRNYLISDTAHGVIGEHPKDQDDYIAISQYEHQGVCYITDSQIQKLILKKIISEVISEMEVFQQDFEYKISRTKMWQQMKLYLKFYRTSWPTFTEIGMNVSQIFKRTRLGHIHTTFIQIETNSSRNQLSFVLEDSFSSISNKSPKTEH